MKLCHKHKNLKRGKKLIKKCFIYGENLFYEEKIAKEKIMQILLDLINNEGVYRFYNGRMSNFDIMCEDCLVELKKTYQNLELCFVYPYMCNALTKQMDYIKSIYDNVSEFNISCSKKTDYTYMDQMYMNFADISDYMITYLERKESKVNYIINYSEEKGVKIELVNLILI